MKKIDVIGIGNAIVDVLAHSDEVFLEKHNIEKGGMKLIDEAEAKAIYADMNAAIEVSGGSVANSIACVAALGGSPGFIGKVADDTLGEIFRHDLKAMGVSYETVASAGNPETGRCLINITPDAQRSMATFLGASTKLSPDDFSAEFIERSNAIFIEGYLFDHSTVVDGLHRACTLAGELGVKRALTISDRGCIERHFVDLPAFIKQHIDILFANEQEAELLFGGSGAGHISQTAGKFADVVIVTRSGNPTIIVSVGGETIEADVVQPNELVDTTGAGDAYAGGFLFGFANGLEIRKCAELGATVAAEIIAQMGARPQYPLSVLT